MRNRNWRVFGIIAPILAITFSRSAPAADLSRVAQCRANSRDFTLFASPSTRTTGSFPVQAIEMVDGESYFLSGTATGSLSEFSVQFPIYLDVASFDSKSCQAAVSALGDRRVQDQETVLLIHGYWISESDVGSSEPLCKLIHEGRAALVDFHVMCRSELAAPGPSQCREIRLLENVIPVDPSQVPPFCESPSRGQN